MALEGNCQPLTCLTVQQMLLPGVSVMRHGTWVDQRCSCDMYSACKLAPPHSWGLIWENALIS